MKKQNLLYGGLLLTAVAAALLSYFSHPMLNYKFEKFTNSIFVNEVTSDTLTLHYTIAAPEKFNIYKYPVTLGHFAEQEETGTVLENYQAVLSQFPSSELSSSPALTKDILSYCLNQKKAGLSYPFYNEIFSPGQGIQSQLPILLAEYEFRNKTDIQDYLTLLSQMDSYFSSALAYEQERFNRNICMADFALQKNIEQCEQFLKNKEHHYLTETFSNRLEKCSFLTSEERLSYEAQNKQIMKEHVFPAYEMLLNAFFNMEIYAPSDMALCQLSKGKNYYQYLVQSVTGSSKTIPEIKTRMQKEFSTDFLAYCDLINDYTSLQAATRNNIFGDSPDLMIKDLQQKTMKDFPSIKDNHITIKYVDESLQDFMSPAFYLTPTLDNINKNVIYINPSSDYSALNLYTTLAHEGYPGHMYQTQYFYQQKPAPLRSLLSFGGYTEGWALYVEMYAYDLSEEDPSFCEIQRLNHSIQLCLFSFMDIGIHYDGLMKADILDNLARYGITDYDTASEIYEYISAEPGIYLKYYLGYLEFMDLRKKAEQTLGNQFSLKDFHKFLLDTGPAPFQILASEEDKWLERQ